MAEKFREKKVMVPNMNIIFNKIRSDIHFLTNNGSYEMYLRVSIPTFWMSILERYYIQEYGFSPEGLGTIFGIKIQQGYNNQICVYDSMASYEDQVAEPILLTFKENLK